jgi:hypothetical protein
MRVPDDFDFSDRQLESSEENTAVAWAMNNGILVRKLQYIGLNGAPDRMFVVNGKIALIEFKRIDRNGRKGRLSEAQVREHALLADAGVNVEVFYTADKAIEFLKSLL